MDPGDERSRGATTPRPATNYSLTASVAPTPSEAEFYAILAGLDITWLGDTCTLGPYGALDDLAALVVEYLAQLIEANPALQEYIGARLDSNGRVSVADLVDALTITAEYVGASRA